MFLNLEQKPQEALAVIDEKGRKFTYGQIRERMKRLAGQIPERSLIFSFCQNTLESLVGYLGFVDGGHVPLMLDHNSGFEVIQSLVQIYRPSFFWAPLDLSFSGEYQEVFRDGDYRLLATGFPSYFLFRDLALLITTSGSTGSPKLVRQSLANLEKNAASIVQYLGINDQERPITTLPMNYVYGLSVINSHMLAGATVLLTTRSLMQKEFWGLFREYEATSIAGVPYTYEILKKLRFFSLKLPSLKTMTQAGGKLMPELHREFAEFAQRSGVKFVVMYGASEATARMGYLPFEKSLEKYGSMGLAIPGGRFILVDEDGRELTETEAVGELVYFGDNVTLGYAEQVSDLSRGDDNRGRLVTGDLARRDSEGYYFIVGRKKRFLKVFGNRVGLDELERLVKSRFPDIDLACAGRDDEIYVFLTSGDKEAVADFLVRQTRLNGSAFKVRIIESIPRNESGKILGSELEKYYD